MIFNDFLNTTLASGNNPKEQLKIDLSTFKSVFNYANKSDDIYNNLIDNIVKLLSIKFGTYQIIYSNIEVMYNELLITLNPQIPQFMMIQKKQLIESLNTFGDLNNWGDVLKDNVSRNLQLTNQSSNTTNFVPIDGSDKDPYSISDVSKTNNSNETTDINRLATDYLNFYMRLNWNVGDIELNSIYESYIHLFKIYYEMDGSSTSSGGSGSDDVWNAINLNTRAIEMVSDEVDTLSVRVDENIVNTNANTSSISNLNNSLNSKANANDVYTKTESDGRFAKVGDISNLQEQINTTNQNVQTNRTNINQTNYNLANNYYNKTQIDSEFDGYYTKTQSDSKYATQTNLTQTNQNVSNLSTNLSTNYYNKSQVDSMTNTLSSNISTVRNMLNQTNSDLANNYYNKTDSDNRYALRTNTLSYTTRTFTNSDMTTLYNNNYSNRWTRVYRIADSNTSNIFSLTITANNEIWADYSWYIYNGNIYIYFARAENSANPTLSFRVKVFYLS